MKKRAIINNEVIKTKSIRFKAYFLKIQTNHLQILTKLV